MEYKTRRELDTLARTIPVTPRTMSRRERLERWAAVLERDTRRGLTALTRVESVRRDQRPFLRADNSPLAIAVDDPVLRKEGLKSDYLGDVMSFFELSPRHAHYLVCDCYYQGTMTAGRVASRIRTLAPRMTWGERWENLRDRWLKPLIA